MATAKRRNDGDGPESGRKPNEDHNPGVAGGGSDFKLSKQAVDSATRGSTGTAIQRFASRDDGWLRIAPDGDGNQGYLKWKFTCAHFHNKYVMVVIPWEDVDDGLDMLEEKVEECWRGLRRPIEDHWFRQL